MSFTGSSLSHDSSVELDKRAISSRYWRSRFVQKVAETPRTSSSCRATLLVIGNVPRSKSFVESTEYPIYTANSISNNFFSPRMSATVSPGDKNQKNKKKQKTNKKTNKTKNKNTANPC